MTMYIHGYALSPLNIYCYSEQTLIYKMSHLSVCTCQA